MEPSSATPVEGGSPAIVLHDAVPGRLRVRLSGLRSADRARRLERALLGSGGLHRATASPETRSVLVVGDAALNPTTLLGKIERAWEIACGRMQSPEPAWWNLEPYEAAALLETGTTGLSSGEASARLARFGRNALQPAEEPSGLQLLLNQFRSLPSLLLMGSAIISMLTGGLFDAALIAGVITANAAIGFLTERRAMRIIHGFVQHATGLALVQRDGSPVEVQADRIVPGDLLLLTAGTAVPADARLMETRDLVIDESMLTGESQPVSKCTDVLADPATPMAERRNMAFGGTLVLSGEAIAVVVATGYLSEIGRIQAAVSETRHPATPLQRRLVGLELGLTLISFAAAAAVFGLGLLHGQSVLQLLPTAAALAIAAIPEGLPSAATVILATGLREMQRQGVLIRRLDAVETLGSVTAICFDKTGTLTQNRMAPVLLAFPDQELTIRDGVFRNGPTVIEPNTAKPLLLLLQVAVLCNESDLESGHAHHVLNGSSTENALLRLAIEAGIDVAALRQTHTLIETEARTEQRRFMRTRHEGNFVAIKGNPEDVLALCDDVLLTDGSTPLSEQLRDDISAQNQSMASRGLRVLGFAHERSGVMTWLGMVGLADPLRPDMPSIIRTFQTAGIRTVMVTGDQAATAGAIAAELHLSDQAQVTDGIATLSAADLESEAAASNVFARITPTEKLRIVRAFQESGEIVAMAGDGSNDAPALRAADIGVALGGEGTAIAREAADVVLAGDDLSTMVIAVRQGRAIYANLRKSVHFLVGTNSGEVLLALAASALGMRQPLTPAQLLWINLLTDVAIAISLGFEPPESDLMAQAPRDPAEPIIGPANARWLAAKGSLFAASALGAHMIGVARHGPGGGGLGFLTLLGAQLLDGLASRSQTQPAWNLPPNRYLTASLLGIAGLQVVAGLVPAVRGILGIGAFGVTDALVIGSGSLAPYLVSELAKMPDAFTSPPMALTSAADGQPPSQWMPESNIPRA